MLGLKYSSGSAEEGFFFLIRICRGEREELKPGSGGRRDEKQKRSPSNLLNPFICQCGGLQMYVCVCVCVYVCAAWSNYRAPLQYTKKSIHLVHDSFNRHGPLLLYCRRKCIITREI